ncbi:Uncharacterized protein APZ42_024992 [Daphnia magna]|uniref:Uncharacterized protein n=1 Tax=Daphnia magna TaxID=35525 RepID=A0A164TJY1_9CRUS|nr:Uncharacterized protein APZ42_024992 [Daphnia magna]
MEYSFFDFLVYFLGPFLLFGLRWILNSILNVFLPHPETLPSPRKIQPEIKLPLSPIKEEASFLHKDAGFLPDGNNSMNNPDEITSELPATLVTAELKRIKLLRELVENAEKKLLQLEAAFDAEKCTLMQSVHTFKLTLLSVEKKHSTVNQQLKETFTRDIMELTSLNERVQAALKLSEKKEQKLEEMLRKSRQETAALRTEMLHAHADQKSHSKQHKQLESVVEEAKYELEQLKETFAKETTELKASIEDDQAALKLAEKRERELENMLGKATQEAEALRTEMSHALANQQALYEEKEKHLNLVAEQAKRQLMEVKHTTQEEIMELKVSNHNYEAALKLAEERQQELEDLLGQATQEAKALRAEMSHALANQQALYEEKEKHQNLVAEQAKRQLMEFKQTTQENMLEQKISNHRNEAALKLAEEKVKEVEEISLKREQAAKQLANEQAAALTEAIDTLQVAVKHARDEVLGETYESELDEEPVRKNETLEEWLIKHGILTRVPPKTWMQLLEHTGFLMEEKAKNLKSKAEMLFHNKPDPAKTE